MTNGRRIKINIVTSIVFINFEAEMRHNKQTLHTEDRWKYRLLNYFTVLYQLLWLYKIACYAIDEMVTEQEVGRKTATSILKYRSVKRDGNVATPSVLLLLQLRSLCNLATWP